MSKQPLSITAAQQALIDAFAFFDHWEERYAYLIDLGKKLPEFPSDWQTDTFLVRGCQSQVWLHAEVRAEQLHFDATSDSAIVRGLIYILLQIYNDRSAAEILQTQPTFIQAIGFDKFISPTRANGLAAMLTTIKQYAQQNLTQI